MNIGNPQQGGGWNDGGVNELTLVPSIPKGIVFNSKKTHMHLLREGETLNENMSIEIVRSLATIKIN